MNQKQKILIVSRSFYPQNSPRAFRTTELAKEFARQGHRVTVITPKSEEHTAFATEHNLKIKDMGEPKWNSVEVKGTGPMRLLRRAVRRFSDLWFEYPSVEYMWLVEKALKNESGYDLMISIAVPFPVHWGVAKARTKDHKIAKTWVADCGDPYMGRENDTFTPPAYFKYVEKWFSRKADYISVPTPGSIDAYYPEFHDKIKVIPQGFNFEEYEVSIDPVKNPVPTFAYAGGFIQGRRDPTEFCEYLISLEQNFKFFIYTRQVEMIAPLANKSRGRIEVRDYIPRRELLSVLSTMDFVVNFENAGPKQTPSKLIDYEIIKKPILSITTGNLNEQHVIEFLAGDYSHRLKIPNPQQYRIENVTAQFLQLIN